MGVIIAKRLSLNRTKGPIFGGIYAARLAKHFEIPIRHYEKEETLLPPTFLDYKSMVAHEFIVNNDDKILLYNLRFHKKHNEIIILPAPSLFDLTAGHCLAGGRLRASWPDIRSRASVGTTLAFRLYFFNYLLYLNSLSRGFFI